MIYYKFGSCRVRGIRRVYLFEHALKSVDGIIEFEKEPSPRIRIGLGMRGYRRVGDDAAKALQAAGERSKASVATSGGPEPSEGSQASEGDSGDSGFLSKLGKAISGKGRKRSKEE